MLDRDDDTRASVVEELSAQDRLDNPPPPRPAPPPTYKPGEEK